MATHDYVLDNATGANFRSDLNNALAAIVSNNSSSSEPSTKYAYQWWADTSAGVLKIRNSANDGWITLLQLDGTLTLEDGTASAPALGFRDDLDTGIFSAAANQLAVTTGGSTRLQVSSQGINVTGTTIDDGATHDGNVTLTGANANAVWNKSGDELVWNDNAFAKFGTGEDLKIHHDGTNSFINNTGGGLRIQDAGSTKLNISGSGAQITGNLDVSSGVDVTGDITVTGDIKNGTAVLDINADTRFEFDIAGTEIVDINGGGIDLLVGNLVLGDNQEIRIGAAPDLVIKHDGTETKLTNASNDLKIINNGDDILLQAADDIFLQVQGTENGVSVVGNQQVALYYNDSQKLETTASGVKINDAIFEIADTSCLIDLMEVGATDSNHRIRQGSGNFAIQRISDDKGTTTDQLTIDGGTGVVSLKFNGSTKLDTNNTGVDITGALTVNGSAVGGSVGGSTGIDFNDNVKVRFGTGNDLEIFSSGSIGHIKAANDDLRLETSRLSVLNRAGNETLIDAYQDGAVELYHDNTKRFVTSNAGVGFVQTGDKLAWPASSGAGPEIYNGGSSVRDLKFNIDNEHKYTLHQNGILYQLGANSSNGGAYSSVAPSYPVRVWLSFNDEDNITNGHGGVSSVSDTGTGAFTINFSDTWPDDNYAMAATSGGAGGSRGDDSCITHGATNPGTGSIGIRTRKFTDNNFTNSESAMFIFVR